MIGSGTDTSVLPAAAAVAPPTVELTAKSAQRMHTAAWARGTWAVCALIGVVQVGTWIWYANAYIVPHYPPGEQSVGLVNAYAGYQRLVQFGFLYAVPINFGIPEGDGILLPNLAAIWFLLSAPMRIYALLLNFVAFLGLELIVARAVYRRTDSRVLAFGSVALLLCAETAYAGSGGLFDFSPRMIAVCGYGAACALVVGWDVFGDWRAATALGALAGLTSLGSFNASVAVAALLVALIVATRSQAHGRRINSVLPLCIFAVLTIPAFLHNWRATHQLALLALEPSRLNQFAPMVDGNGTVGETLPRYVVDLSRSQLSLAFAVGFVALVLAAVFRAPGRGRSTDGAWVMTAAAAAVFAPLTSVLVAPWSVADPLGLMLPALVLGALSVAEVVRVQRPVFHASVHYLTALIVGACACVAVVVHLGRPPVGVLSPDQMSIVDRMLGDLSARLLESGGMPGPVIANSTDDFASTAALEAFGFEHRGPTDRVVLRTQSPLSELANRGDRLPSADGPYADSADALLIASPASESRSSQFQARLASETDSLLALAERELVPIGSYALGGRTFRTYARPRPRLDGLSDDGWVTAAGFRVVLPGWSAGVVRSVQMEGIVQPGSLTAPPQVTARVANHGAAGTPVPAQLSFASGRYTLLLDTARIARSTADEDTAIQVDFSASFVPAVVGINDDRRELVVRAPDQIRAITADQ